MLAKSKALLVTALLALGGAEWCAAAPKVSIRIVPRASPDGSSVPSGPVPFRPPMIHWNGPFVSELPSTECLKQIPATINTQAVLVDVCRLKNVTFVPEVAEGEAAQRKILGIYRGWRVDPITLRYKQMVFDDGDECGDPGARMTIVLELVTAKNPDTKPRVYGFKQENECSFSAKLLIHLPLADLKVPNGIHTPGVLDIIDAKQTLPHVCGQMKCRYNMISSKIQAVMTEIRQAKEIYAEVSSAKAPDLATFSLSSSKAILRSANSVLDRSLELLQTLEHLQVTLQGEIDEKQRARDAEEAGSAASSDDESADATKDSASTSADEEADSEGSQEQDGRSSADEAEEQVAEGVREVVVEADGA
ncbi:hypothetical protein PybrP1_011709 [[Pythium] brassicae (nom. inval.)]|nr:hypothetical protein PybrP1_011709 [[Pythium] brassicae (nom. inval.)]